MDRINNITVNGVTYEIGGSGGSSEQIYTVPNLDALETFSSTAVKEALGGASGVESLFQAVKNGKIIVMKDSTMGGAVVINARFKSAALLMFVWLYYDQSFVRPYYRAFTITRLSETTNSVMASTQELALFSDTTP